MIRYSMLVSVCFALSACALHYPKVALFSDDVIDRAYLKLTLYQPNAARELIDHAIDFYIDKDLNKNEGLAVAYTASTDYFRYVTTDGYLETAKFIRLNTVSVAPLALSKVLKQPLSSITLAESKLAENSYKRLINRSSGRNKHYQVIHYYSKLLKLYSNNVQTAQSCSALDAILKHYTLAKRIFPDHSIAHDASKYQSYVEQIVAKKASMHCVDYNYQYNNSRSILK